MDDVDGKYHLLDTECKMCKLTKNRPVNYYYSVHKNKLLTIFKIG